MRRSTGLWSAVRAAGVAAVAALAWSAAAPAGAGAQVPLKLGLGGGVLAPTGDLKDAVDNGVVGVATLRLGAPVIPLHLRADGMYGKFNGKSGGTDLTMYAAVANAGWDVIPLGLATVYVTGGGGYYWVKPDIDGATTEGNPGWNAGAGIRFTLASLRLFAEARYHSVSMDAGKATFVPVTAGIMF